MSEMDFVQILLEQYARAIEDERTAKKNKPKKRLFRRSYTAKEVFDVGVEWNKKAMLAGLIFRVARTGAIVKDDEVSVSTDHYRLTVKIKTSE